MRVRSIKVAFSQEKIYGPEKRTVYKVLVVKNSTEYYPGQEMSKSTVDALCADRQWDVTIVALKEDA